MREKRQCRRANLLYYLQVYDLEALQEIGHLVDMSFGGFKMIGKIPMVRGNVYCLEISLPDDYFLQKSFKINARCCWLKTDINPDYYATGFSFTALTLENLQLIKKLMLHYGINSSVTLAV